MSAQRRLIFVMCCLFGVACSGGPISDFPFLGGGDKNPGPQNPGGSQGGAGGTNSGDVGFHGVDAGTSGPWVPQLDAGSPLGVEDAGIGESNASDAGAGDSGELDAGVDAAIGFAEPIDGG